MAAAVAPGSPLTIATPKPLFPVDRYRADPNHTNYAVGTDDRSFYFSEPQRDGDDHVVMVLNWFRELEARMAARQP